MENKFKVGDIVKCVSNNYDNDRDLLINRIGKIIHISINFYTVEFFEPVRHGHAGYGVGKSGYCRLLYEDEIELYISILKLFLKEKQNGI